MILVFSVTAAAAALLYFVMTSKKTINHVLREIKYDLKMEDIGFWGLVEDRRYKKMNVLGKLPDKTGQVAVVTGGARGLGFHVVKTLVECGMTVVIGVRNVEAGEKIARELQERGLPGVVKVYQLDVASMKSVREFGKKITEDYPKIDLLVNNAGIMMGDFKLTEDGFENQLATNYMGHFLLTHYLLSSLKAAGESAGKCARVVNVTSIAHRVTPIHLDDINWKGEYVTTAAYAQSKLAQVMSARYLDKIFHEEGIKVRCYSTHPGIVNTDLFDGTPVKRRAKWVVDLFFKKPEDGATPILYTCFSDDLEDKGGSYISNCRIGGDSEYSKREDVQKKLHELSCEMLNVKKFGKV